MLERATGRVKEVAGNLADTLRSSAQMSVIALAALTATAPHAEARQSAQPTTPAVAPVSAPPAPTAKLSNGREMKIADMTPEQKVDAVNTMRAEVANLGLRATATTEMASTWRDIKARLDANPTKTEAAQIAINDQIKAEISKSFGAMSADVVTRDILAKCPPDIAAWWGKISPQIDAYNKLVLDFQVQVGKDNADIGRLLDQARVKLVADLCVAQNTTSIKGKAASALGAGATKESDLSATYTVPLQLFDTKAAEIGKFTIHVIPIDKVQFLTLCVGKGAPAAVLTASQLDGELTDLAAQRKASSDKIVASESAATAARLAVNGVVSSSAMRDRLAKTVDLLPGLVQQATLAGLAKAVVIQDGITAKVADGTSAALAQPLDAGFKAEKAGYNAQMAALNQQFRAAMEEVNRAVAEAKK